MRAMRANVPEMWVYTLKCAPFIGWLISCAVTCLCRGGQYMDIKYVTAMIDKLLEKCHIRAFLVFSTV